MNIFLDPQEQDTLREALVSYSDTLIQLKHLAGLLGRKEMEKESETKRHRAAALHVRLIEEKVKASRGPRT